MKSLYFLSLILLLSNCSPESSIQRATKTRERAEATQDTIKARYHDLIAEKFAEWFTQQEAPEKTEVAATDTVQVPVIIKGDCAPCPEPVTAPTGRKYSPMVKHPDLTHYRNALTSLTKRKQQSDTALAEARNKYSLIQQKLRKEQEARRQLKEEVEKNRKIKTAWLWFNIFLGLTVAVFIIGKIFKFI